jgi:hypothetical protein
VATLKASAAAGIKVPLQRGEESMPGPVLRTTFQSWNREAVAADSSFEAVCLFSALGIIFSLVFLLTIGPAFDLGLME